jgi:glycosyltransferase involved in cell wall biosynthesis
MTVPRVAPMISVVVPTRERCHTLVHTLQTCADQDYENCEILVSDNYSQDDTQAVVASVRDKRIRYVNTGRRLSMSHNWEFALSLVRGDYVTYVGDDDALLPGALSALATIVGETGTPAITWQWASYFWPDCVHTASSNLLFVPARNGLELRQAPAVLRKVLQFRQGYENLPFFYKGLVSTALIEQVKKCAGGAFFHSMIPDVYSAVALSFVVTDYYYSYKPYSVNGTSAQSNGAAQLDPTLSAARAFLSEPNIPFHEQLVLAPSTSILLAEAFLQAREHMRQPPEYSFDIKELLNAAMRESATAPADRYGQVCNAVRAIGAKHGLADEAARIIGMYPHAPRKKLIGLTEGFNLVNRMQVIDCSRLGVRNIHQAAALCSAILNAGEMGFIRNPLALAKTTFILGTGVVARMIDRWTGGPAEPLQ